MYRKALMLRTNLTSVAVSLFLLSVAGYAQAKKGEDPLFQSDAVLDVEIEAPFKMLADKRPNEEEFPGKFRFTADDGSLVEFDIVLRTRGRLRRSKETCTFPPLRLNFKKSQLDDTLFDKQDKIKLVSHCRNNAFIYEQGVIAEYLAYRILNLFTEKSFQVRLLHTRYVFADDDRVIESYAILIEHKDRLEKRLGVKTADIEKARVADIEPEDLNLASVFQYFIGNTDFSPVATAPDEDCCHNQALLLREEGLAYTVPYDFDQSGLVDAPYAAPNPRFKIRSPRQRVYRGRCVNNEHLPATLDLFRERREEIQALVSAQQELDSRVKKSMLEFIGKFYKTIDSPKRVQRKLVRECL